MKKIFLLLIAAMVISCSTTGPQITTGDEKSKSILAAFDSYLANDYSWADTLYSPEILIYINSVEAVDVKTNIAGLASHHELFSDISITGPSEEGGAYVQTTNYNNNAGVWSHAWFVWKATGKATGKTIQIPVHVAYKWDNNGSISETYLFSDQAPQLAEINASQMQ